MEMKYSALNVIVFVLLLTNDIDTDRFIAPAISTVQIGRTGVRAAKRASIILIYYLTKVILEFGLCGMPQNIIDLFIQYE